MKDKDKRIMGIVRGCSVVLAAVGAVGNQAEFLLAACMLLWMHNCVYAVRNQSGRFPFLLFHVTVFTFLLGRPLMTALNGDGLVRFEVENYGATPESVGLALLLLYLSLLGLWSGARISEAIEKNRTEKSERKRKREWPFEKAGSDRSAWRQAALLVFAGSFVCEIAATAEKVLFILSHSYVSYYADFESRLPYVIYVGSTFMFFSMCIWLALLPEKKQAYLVLSLYVLLRLPMAICGARTEVVLALLFAMTYFFFRDYLEGKREWVGKWERRLMAAGGVLGIVALGLVNYVREGKAAGGFSPVFLFLDFFFKQGVTFSWVSAGLAHVAQLRSRGVVSYTFGLLIDWLRHGVIARLFGAEVLAGGNTIQNAMESNLLAYHLPWILFGKEKYLQGHGMGSCYILELFLDFGFPGVFLAGIVIGICLFSLFRCAKKNVLSWSFWLMTINGFLYMPRATALQPINFIWRPPFWLSYIGIFLLGNLIKNYRERRKQK